MPIQEFFNVNTIFFTFLDYPMSYLEFFGTIFNIGCVYLAAKNKIATWPIGIIGVICYIFLFYQIQLYSDFIEQLYFLVSGFYGWYVWHKIGSENVKGVEEAPVMKNSLKANLMYAAIIGAGSLGMGYFMQNIHIYFPAYFPIPASFPYLDAFTTVMSFAAQFLMAKKRVECWYLWVFVDIIGIWLYYTKGVKFIALEYVVFLVLASKGLIEWQRKLRGQSVLQKSKEALV
jgi:nicotinamide mononucleotide transporter